MRRVIVFIIILLAGCSLLRDPNNPLLLLDQDYSFRSIDKMGFSFPPVKDTGQRQLTMTEINNLNVRKIRFAENWRAREETKGSFNWSPLEERIDYFYPNGVSILLTVQSDGPAWAVGQSNADSAIFLNDSDFSNYTVLLAGRCAGKVSKIQFGNEWNSDYGYVGTKEQYAHFQNQFYSNIKSVAPSMKVVLGGISSGALNVLAYSLGWISVITDDHGVAYGSDDRGSVTNDAEVKETLERLFYVLTNAVYDVLDLHMYDDCENWPVYLSMMRSLVPGKEVILSEFGGPDPVRDIYTDYYQAQRLYQYMKTLDTMDHSEAYYFKLVESSESYHKRSALLREFLMTRKPSYDVFNKMMHSR